jgi:signal peptidase I
MSDLFRAVRKNPFVDFVITIAVAIVIAYFVQLWIVKPFQIPSQSMKTTFHVGDRILAARFLYHFTDPARGDIIVFHPNGFGDNPEPTDHVASVVFVKRLIGLPGEWIRARGGHVQICTGDGTGCRVLDEPYVSSPQEDFPAPPQRAIHIPAGRYFMMGDNRANSDDSRIWGPITRAQIIGRAFMIYWPPDRISFF